MTLHLNKLECPSPSDALCLVSLKSADRQRKNLDQKSFGLGELKTYVRSKLYLLMY